MFDNVTITYRGATYEIGRGAGFYGVWTVWRAEVAAARAMARDP